MYRALAQDKSLWRTLVLVGMLVGVVLGAPAGVWAITYTFTTIDVPGAPSTVTVPGGINDYGQIVGVYYEAGSSGEHGFLFDHGVFTTIDVPGGSNTEANGINNYGQIIGSYVGSGQQRGFLYDKGTFSTIDIPFPTVNQARPNDINDSGLIVGEYLDQLDLPHMQHGFFDDRGMFSSIDVPGACCTLAEGINDHGEIVGVYAVSKSDGSSERHGFVYDGGGFTTIDVSFPNADGTTVNGTNNHGQLVGSYMVGGWPHGFLYSEGVFISIDVPGALQTVPFDINNRGQIVGFYYSLSSGGHGFIATPDPTSPPATPDPTSPPATPDPTSPPVINITATPDILWPPNGEMVPVTITGTITDEDSNVEAITATYEVEDEYGSVQPRGDVNVESDGSYAFTIQLQASRNSNDLDGREYTITVSAQDNEGNTNLAKTSFPLVRK